MWVYMHSHIFIYLFVSICIDDRKNHFTLIDVHVVLDAVCLLFSSRPDGNVESMYIYCLCNIDKFLIKNGLWAAMSSAWLLLKSQRRGSSDTALSVGRDVQICMGE